MTGYLEDAGRYEVTKVKTSYNGKELNGQVGLWIPPGTIVPYPFKVTSDMEFEVFQLGKLRNESFSLLEKKILIDKAIQFWEEIGLEAACERSRD